MVAPTAYERVKNPAKVRADLIAAAARVICDLGLARLTVDAVARAAGVTKGGLFHHFPTKQDLIAGVLGEMLDIAGRTIGAQMATDPVSHGRFTRAYLHGVFTEHKMPGIVSSRTLCLAMLADPALQSSWSDWVEQQVRLHAATDDNMNCALVRLAADGTWLASLRNPEAPPPVSVAVREALVALTLPVSGTDCS